MVKTENLFVLISNYLRIINYDLEVLIISKELMNYYFKMKSL